MPPSVSDYCSFIFPSPMINSHVKKNKRWFRVNNNQLPSSPLQCFFINNLFKPLKEQKRLWNTVGIFLKIVQFIFEKPSCRPWLRAWSQNWDSRFKLPHYNEHFDIGTMKISSGVSNFISCECYRKPQNCLVDFNDSCTQQFLVSGFCATGSLNF